MDHWRDSRTRKFLGESAQRPSQSGFSEAEQKRSTQSQPNLAKLHHLWTPRQAKLAEPLSTCLGRSFPAQVQTLLRSTAQKCFAELLRIPCGSKQVGSICSLGTASQSQGGTPCTPEVIEPHALPGNLRTWVAWVPGWRLSPKELSACQVGQSGPCLAEYGSLVWKACASPRSQTTPVLASELLQAVGIGSVWLKPVRLPSAFHRPSNFKPYLAPFNFNLKL